jgi:ABC-type glycerol-3-phosphate transport system permease component
VADLPEGDDAARDVGRRRAGGVHVSPELEQPLIPLLYLPGGEFRPLTLGLYLFAGGRTIDVGPLAAGTLITILPVVVLFVLLQRQVSKGLLAGAVKG